MSVYEETDRDRWAESEARQCDKIADAISESGQAWLSKMLHPDNAKMALVCAIKAEAWREIADSLRRPAAIGRERAERGQ